MRDGSFDYYVSEPVVTDDLKGVGPFVLAGIEM
jgi:rhamnogalacturonyl hydrolase YesR